MAKLLILEGPDRGREIELKEGTEIVIGRSSSCDVTLADEEASRQHCQVAYADGSLSITDLNSSNGTFVNGRRVTEAPLEADDMIELGETRLRLEIATPDASPAEDAGTPGDPFIGRTIGDYKIVERLGEGRLGMPYKGLHVHTGGAVVMKILPPMVGQKEEIVQRFTRQAKAGADFKHVNVVETFGAGKVGKVHYIITEYVEGRTLQELIDEQGEGGKLDAALVLDVMLQIGHALEYAYEHKIVHRDIKPGNIVVAADGTAKLDNLWLAKHVEGTTAEPQLTEPGKALGTLCYMAPEQIGDARNVDCRADIYSLAATIYRALTGEAPCKGSTTKETLDKVRNEAPKSVREFNEAVPPAVASPIDRALSKSPDERQQTPKELVIELKLARKYQVR